VDNQISDGLLTPFSKAQFNPVVHRLARTTPYYDRNRAHICSFFVKGTCNRGILCPFRHEKPEEASPLSHQNIKDRYYGVNDPVAHKLLSRSELMEPTKPDDKSVTTLYVGNVDKRISEQDLRDHFYYFGEITSLLLLPAQNCAFIEFETRAAAEAVFKKYQSNLIVNGIFLKIAWARPQQLNKPAPIENPALISRSSDYYPSMDSERLGARPEDKEKEKKTTQSAATVSPVLNAPNWDQSDQHPQKTRKLNS